MTPKDHGRLITSWPSCDQRGPYDAWQMAKPLVRDPICNRPKGHQGWHAEYDRRAIVRARWEPK